MDRNWRKSDGSLAEYCVQYVKVNHQQNSDTKADNRGPHQNHRLGTIQAKRSRMDVLTAVLADVSGSMKSSVIGTRGREGGEWVRSIFRVVDNLIKYDVSSRNKVFALGFGASRQPYSFDLINTIEKYQQQSSASEDLNHRQTLESILCLLERNGAPRVRHWASMESLLRNIKETVAKLFLNRLETDYDFRRKFVYEILPQSCRHVQWLSPSSLVGEVGYLGAKVTGMQDTVTEGSIQDVVSKGKNLLDEKRPFETIGPASIIDVHSAQKILHGSIRQEELTNERIDELMESIELSIYGDTPMIKCLNAAIKLFSIPEYKEHKKLLFILSDGEPTDGRIPPTDKLESLNVLTVGCFITEKPIADPKRLYSTSQYNWENGARFLFNMSSYVTTQDIPRTMFVKKGWKIDYKENKTRMFVQVNHPDIIDDVCDLARDVVCCRDALSDMLSSIDLDLYINKANQSIVPENQKGKTSYANALATVLHLAMKRITELEGGVPDFFKLRNEILEEYGKHEGNTFQVLREVCRKYNGKLQWKKVDVDGALTAITEKRPVFAKFQLTDEEMDNFSRFFCGNPCGILASTDLGNKCSTEERQNVHGAVLTSFDSQSLRLLISGGDNWGDGGFFRVSDAGVLGMEFVDVYWTASDHHGADVAQRLMDRLNGLQTAQYICPKCHQSSGLGEFTGHALESKCPKCKSRFRFANPGEDLALNLYLLSLSTSARGSVRT